MNKILDHQYDNGYVTSEYSSVLRVMEEQEAIFHYGRSRN